MYTCLNIVIFCEGIWADVQIHSCHCVLNVGLHSFLHPLLYLVLILPYLTIYSRWALIDIVIMYSYCMISNVLIVYMYSLSLCLYFSLSLPLSVSSFSCFVVLIFLVLLCLLLLLLLLCSMFMYSNYQCTSVGNVTLLTLVSLTHSLSLSLSLDLLVCFKGFTHIYLHTILTDRERDRSLY